MPARQYPFIDIAVHARVREHFARGDAAILFSRDFARILWANDQGAAFFGAGSIYDFIDAGPNQGDLSLRQLKAVAAQLTRAGDRRQLSIRKFSGFRGTPLTVSVEMIRVRPDEDAILFAAPHSGAPLSLEDRAARMIAGLDGPDTHMAVLNGSGGIIAHSPGFVDLGMSDETRKQLVDAVGRDHDWLIKRPVATRKGHLPAAVGKIADDPSLHLLFAVETILGTLDPDEEEAPAAQALPILPPAEDPQPDTEAPLAGAPDMVEPAEALIDAAAPAETFEQAEPPEADAAPQDDGDVDNADTGLAADQATLPTEPEVVAAAHIPDAVGDADIKASAQAVEPAQDDDKQALADETLEDNAHAPTSAAPATAEDATHNEETIEATGAGADQAEQSDFAFVPGGRAVRFVWKIDAEGRFSEISEEFATAVGPRAADVIGTTFTEVATRYGLDPDQKIGALLQRRDTWSGKTIFWPVQGTSLKVPVDLAALPTYSRSREFDGFRGFGIVRLADAIEDEHANGLAFGAIPAEDVAEAQGEAEAAPSEVGTHASSTGPEIEALPAHQEQALEQRPADTEAEPAATTPDRNAPEDQPLLFGTEHAGQGDDDVAAGEQDATSDYPSQGEHPALQVVDITENPGSDKVVELEKHRAAAALTRGEQAAFREIARQLGEHFGKPAAEAAPAEEGDAAGDANTPFLVGAHDAVSSSTPATEEQAAAADTSAETDGSAAKDEQANEDLQPQAADIGLSGEILDSLPIGMLVHRGDELLHANPEFLRLTGYGDLDDFVREGGIDALFANGEEATDQEPDGTMTLIRKDGQMRPVTARLHTIRWDGRSALMLALTPSAANMPSTRLDEALTGDDVDGLKTEIDELKSILETATDGVVILGHDGDIRSMNRSASALFNYDEGEIRGKPFAALFAHESQKAVIDYLHGLSGHGVASVLNDGREVIGREASGGFIPLFMTIGRLSASNGFCAVIRDITQWKRTEEELRNAKRAAETANAHKTEFLARVSHEIRTPLNAIIGFSDMMASEHFGPVGHPRYIEYAGDIGRSGRHVLDIVNDLLDISKIEAGEMELDFGAVEINEAVSEAVSLVQPQANSQRVIIRTSLSAAVPNVVADGRSIKQIALNILANAIRFTPSGGQIVVSTSYEANGSVMLRIRDTGVGMTRGELEQAMKPFRQVTSGARKRGDGTGLGLPLTKAMAEANRAQFSITSAPNEGTLVEISFPSQRVLAN
ncbi:PAS domain S-box protein [Ensifer adhaerens]|uniref:PAS domain S-box protein n=1 Tax=Ensifer adhaerens TaxID=106592 RepID=UPI000CF19213|nr:PAS domain S-box protein [Ensifer adhaerens]